MGERRTTTEQPVSRRGMLKRLGAGAAIAWSAPVLSSIAVPAFGQGGSEACHTCQDVGCQPGIQCAEGCLCIRSVEGSCTCVGRGNCGNPHVQPCNSTADCQTGYTCVDTCRGCRNVTRLCLEPCTQAEAFDQTADGYATIIS